MTQRKKRDPAAFTDGTPVEYQPVMGPREPWYRGVVRGAPFKLGHGAWVVQLRDMEPAYSDAFRSPPGMGPRTIVLGALLQALRLVKPPRVAVEPPPMRAAAELSPASLDQQTERLRAFASRGAVPLGRIRDALDRTQSQTAYALGIGSASISHTETHVDTATIATLTRYARALGGELEVAVRVLGERVVVKVPPIGEKRSRTKKKEQATQ